MLTPQNRGNEDTYQEIPGSEYKPFSNLQVVKNLIVISVGCLLAFCAYDGLVMLQSTINQSNGIGVTSVAVQFAFSCVTALLLPEYLFEKIGCKAVITICLVLFVPYIASNFYPHWSLMIPASILIGLANSLYWAAQSAYLNHLSILFCSNLEPCKGVGASTWTLETGEKMGGQVVSSNSQDLDKEPGKIIANNKSYLLKNAETPDAKVTELLSSITARFFGIHGLIYQTCHVWGNLLSYYVLRIGAVEEEWNLNNTICQCGFDFCNIQTNCSTKNLMEPRADLRNLLIGVFVSISILAVVFVLFFLDELQTRSGKVSISWEYMAATCKQIKDKRQLLLIPMSLNIGVMQGFVMGDFTKDFVACAWGVHHVGLVTACMGATLALSSSLSGFLVKHLGRRTVFLVAKGVNIAAVIILCLWKPTSEETFMFFVLSGMLGAVLGTFWSQLRAFYGVLFKQKEGAAFANYQLWHAIGMAMTFAYSNAICTAVKIYIYLAFSSFGMIGYLLAEKLHANSMRTQARN